MTARDIPVKRVSRYPAVLRGAALTLVPLASFEAVALTLWVGRHNRSLILVTLMAIWVLSPFVALMRGESASKTWPFRTRMALHSSMLALSLASLVAYTIGSTWPPFGHGAFVFVGTPPVLWLLMAIMAFAFSRLSRGRAKRVLR